MPQHVGGVFFIAETDILQIDRRLARLRNGFFIQRTQRVRLRITVQPFPALRHRDGTSTAALRRVPDAHGRRQRKKAAAIHALEVLTRPGGRVVGNEAAVFQYQHLVAHRKNIL